MTISQHSAWNGNAEKRSYPQRSDQLTPREEEILLLKRAGYTRKQIATELGISLHTVDTHIRHIKDSRCHMSSAPSGKGYYRSWCKVPGVEQQNAENNAHEHECCEQVIARTTRMQKEVLWAFAKGLTPKEVAAHLCLAPGTINTHLGALLRYCRKAWKLPDGDKRINYIFLYQKFSGYVDRLRAEIKRA